MRIAVDFDGTLCKRSGIPRKDDYLASPPQEGALEAIWWLYTKGHKPYILTARHEINGIYWWLYYNGFPEMEITNEKQEGTAIYLDDRAIRFTNWQDFCKYIG